MDSFPEMSEQYAALDTGCAIADFSGRVQIELTGSDRASFLHNLCTADVRGLKPGQGCEAFFANVQGKILGHVLIFALSDSHILETIAGQNEKLMDHLDRYVIREDVELHDRTGQWQELILGGKKAAALLAEKTGGSVPQQPGDHLAVTISGCEISLRRVEILPGDAFLLSGSAGEIQTVRETLQQSGAVICSSQAIDSARVEAGWPYYGVDISEDHLPQEVDRNEKAISFTKGCYLGQEIVARIDALGHVNKKLVGVRFQAGEIPPAGSELAVAEKAVGRITSAVFSSRLKCPLALAYVRREHCESGTKLSTGISEAEVIKLPLSTS